MCTFAERGEKRVKGRGEGGERRGEEGREIDFKELHVIIEL